jgi:hypothetical protein
MLLKLQLKQVPSVIYFAVSVSQFDNITTGYMLHFVIKYKILASCSDQHQNTKATLNGQIKLRVAQIKKQP